MPSTYTGSGIELIGNGEQAGTWGQTTNTNLQIINRMTSEAGAIALSGTTHTLTISDGVLSDGQYGVLVFGGSPSGTNTVTISPNDAKRVFIVRNNTAQSVVLTQGSGGNVTVPTSTTKIVYSNGAGASAAIVDLTSTLAASLVGNVTGNLTGNVTGNVTGNASTATTLQTARNIGGVSFNGSADINLPGVNQAGNQNTTGSAASLTTARTINGVSFNGTANITLPTVNDTGNQNVAGVKTFTTAIAVTGTSKAAGQFYAGTTAPTNTTRLNYDGALHATSFTGDGANLTGITRNFVLLATGTASASSSLDFTAFNSSLYGNYLFVVSNLVLSAAANLNVRTSTNGGSTYDSGASDYAWWSGVAFTGGIDRNGSNAANAVSLLYSPPVAAAALGIGGTLYLFGPEVASFTGMVGNFCYTRASTDYAISYGMGARLSVADVDGIRFIPASGNITSGTIRMYGIIK